MKKLILILIGLMPIIAMAQQPKMYIKLFGGSNANQFVYRIDDVDSDVLVGWQLGGGFRVDHREAFLEFDIAYIQSGLTIVPGQDSDFDIEDPLEITMRSLEVPISIGYVPVKTPLFKWFLYGGLANRFSMKGRYDYQGETYKFRPKELSLHFYNLGVRFGTQVDIAMFNFDLNYTLGITNGLRERVRTNTHSIQLNVGLLF